MTRYEVHRITIDTGDSKCLATYGGEKKDAEHLCERLNTINKSKNILYKIIKKIGGVE